MTDYFNPTEPNYFMPPPNVEERLSEPIVSTKKLGATVAEQQQGGGTFLHNIQSQIRAGTGTVQLMFNVPHTSAVGGRPKGYGKEVREAMRQVIKQAGVDVTGAEMPTSSMTNMSGYNQQMDEFSDQVLESHKQEVRDAMQFLIDVTGGGGIDVVSFEFPRTIVDQEWAENGKLFEGHKNEKETGIKKLVDRRTGRKHANIPMNMKAQIPVYTEKDGEFFPELKEDGTPKTKEIKITHYEDVYENGRKVKAKEELFFEEYSRSQLAQLKGQIKQQKGEIAYSEYLINGWEKELNKPGIAEEEKKKLQTVIDGRKKGIEGSYAQMAASKQKAKEYEEDLKHIRSAETFGVEKTMNSYAELGIYAMQETDANKKDLDKDLWVGPELGWPQQYGGQPKEWINIIQGAREKMVELLTNPEIEAVDGTMKKNDLFRADISHDQAVKEANQHIKGVFDTGHLGMWLNNFRRKPGESEKDRIDKFNEWYLEQIDDIIKADVVGDIQVVDSQSGAHAHLPPGEGILPLKETINKFQKSNFEGGIISEGHEEEGFGKGRIITQTWKHFGAIPGGIYGPSGAAGGMGPIYGTPWGNIQNAYFGRTYTPFFIVGAYSPSNDWKVWSEVPLE